MQKLNSVRLSNISQNFVSDFFQSGMSGDGTVWLGSRDFLFLSGFLGTAPSFSPTISFDSYFDSIHTNWINFKMPRGGKAISDSSIRALERGVAVLQAVNRLHGAKPGDIAEYTGIPRPSVYRLLKTLAEMGMVSKDHFSNRWRPTRHVKSLSSGFREEDWVCQVAVPHMIQLGRDVLWPLDLMTLRGYHMEVRESTHQISPYSVQHGMVGKQVPLIETASGRVLLANMADTDRQALLNLFSEATGQTPPFITRDGVLETLLAKVRKLGVGIRSADFTPETGSISAPIWYEDRVFACLTLIWSTSSLSLEKSLLLYREKLLQTADAISRDLVGNLTSAEIAQFREAS